jgi:hypothetical protein
MLALKDKKEQLKEKKVPLHKNPLVKLMLKVKARMMKKRKMKRWPKSKK